MTDNFPVTLAGAFDALDLADPDQAPTLDPDCHEACGLQTAVVETCVSTHACSDTPGRA